MGSDEPWAIRESRIANNSGDGVGANVTSAGWTIHESAIVGNGNAGIHARHAEVAGNASYNYWGARGGPSGDFNGSGDAAVGNLTVTPFYADAAMTTLRNTTGSTTTCVALAVAGEDATTSLAEIQSAIDYWAEGAEVQGTGGQTISLSEIQSLIDAWAEGSTVSCP
jgi:hypothetical protein